jgi:ribosome-binding factor A
MKNNQPTFDKHDRATITIREALAVYVQHEANTNPLITVTNVSIAPDYKRATVMFTTIPDDREADAQIFMKRHANEMRNHLKKHTRLKRIPHLEFSVDYGERHRQHIDEIAKEIEK